MTSNSPASPATSFQSAARVVIHAAHTLAADQAVSIDHRRCRAVAASLEGVMASGNASPWAILAASPSVWERSGKRRTLVEMIEAEEGGEGEKVRLARLLLRALAWD